MTTPPTTTLRALTVRQPWADAITHGTKRTENRTWATKYRGPVLIHAGAAYDRMGRFVIRDWDTLDAWPDTRSTILAIADLTDCHAYTNGCCEPWGEWDVYHWTLTNVRRLPVPVPCKGRLGLWTPDADVLAAVHEQLNPAVASSGSVAARADGAQP